MKQEFAPMDSALAGLYASTPQPLPFAPTLDIRAFLLRREEGNLLVYSVATLDSDAAAIHGLGGVARHYLNHRHEAMFAPGSFVAPLFIHEDERESVEGKMHVDETFSGRHVHGDDFEVIPIPGHTRGTTAFLWDSGEHRVLFTGDTIYLDDGEWVAAVLESSDRGRYVESLEAMRELDFDVLVPWAATRAQPYRAVASRAEVRRRIDAIIARVRRGEDR